MPPASFRSGLVLALLLVAAPVHALEVILDYQYDESGFFDDPRRRAVLEHAVRQFTAALDADLGALPAGEWAAVFPHPGRANAVVYRDLAVERSTLHVFVAAHPRGGGEPARGVPGYVAWRCETPEVPGACARSAAERSAAEQRAWLERYAFRSNPAAAAWPPRAFSPWGGALSFASDVNWYVGIDGPVPAGQLDLLSSAEHALGHVLGVGTSSAWTARAVRGRFEGPETVAETGSDVPLSADRTHFAVGGAFQRPAFSAPPGPGERALLTALDEAALHDIGWNPSDRGSTSDSSAGVILKGDVDGDGLVGLGDLLALEAYLAGADSDLAARVEARGSAADVAPMLAGEAVGDGRLDRDDVAVLRSAVVQRDVDGDGIPTALENQLNERFGASAGSLVYHPLQRGPDACAATRSDPLLSFVSNGRAVPFCGADGKAWFDVPVALPPARDARSIADMAIVGTLGFTESGAQPRVVPIDILPPFASIRMSGWSVRPEVSPELYLEIVRAEERRSEHAALSAPRISPTARVESASAAAVRTRRGYAEGGEARADSSGEPPRSARSVGLPMYRDVSAPPADTTAGPADVEPGIETGVEAAPEPELQLRRVARPSVPPAADAPGPPRAVRERADSASSPPQRALLSEFLSALSKLWEQLRSLVGL